MGPPLDGHKLRLRRLSVPRHEAPADGYRHRGICFGHAKQLVYPGDDSARIFFLRCLRRDTAKRCSAQIHHRPSVKRLPVVLSPRVDHAAPFAHGAIVPSVCYRVNVLNSEKKRLVGTPRRWTECKGWRDSHHPPAIAAHDLPVAFMHHPVMAVTEQEQVVEIRGSAVDPVDDMM